VRKDNLRPFKLLDSLCSDSRHKGSKSCHPPAFPSFALFSPLFEGVTRGPFEGGLPRDWQFAAMSSRFYFLQVSQLLFLSAHVSLWLQLDSLASL
jgi:hypothetical protein